MGEFEPVIYEKDGMQVLVDKDCLAPTALVVALEQLGFKKI